MKAAMIFLVFCLLKLGAAEGATSVTHNGRIDLSCQESVESEEKFSHFRRSLFCLSNIDTCRRGLGWQFLSAIVQKYPHLLLKWEALRKNDAVGDPITEPFDVYGSFCPATLRYIKIAGDLEALFGNLDGKTIVEIGGGYGGQCRILSALFSFKEYIIIDLPEVLRLAKRFLDQYGVKNVRYLTPDQLPVALMSDLLISNYAFSECFYEMQIEYTQKILKHARSGYMICNDFGYFTASSFRDYFSPVKQDLAFTLETPQTGSSNYLITWGITLK